MSAFITPSKPKAPPGAPQPEPGPASKKITEVPVYKTKTRQDLLKEAMGE